MTRRLIAWPDLILSSFEERLIDRTSPALAPILQLLGCCDEQMKSNGGLILKAEEIKKALIIGSGTMGRPIGGQ